MRAVLHNGGAHAANSTMRHGCDVCEGSRSGRITTKGSRCMRGQPVGRDRGVSNGHHARPGQCRSTCQSGAGPAGGRSGGGSDPPAAPAIKIDPTMAEAHNTLGAALYDRGQFALAQAEFAGPRRSKPEYALAHYNLGLDPGEQGKIKLALPELRRAVALAAGVAAYPFGAGRNAAGERPEGAGTGDFSASRGIRPGRSGQARSASPGAPK